MSKELTYILGAGASYQSIPIVRTFSSRFNEFLVWIDRDIVRSDGFSADEKQKFRILYELAKSLHKSFETHQSFDTYFKKLFHTGQWDKISKGKKILNLYFVWEHLSLPTPKPHNYNESIFWKQSLVDKRYDALIAGLLKPLSNNRDTYCKVNFLTWNYDLNLLISLKNYFLPNSKIAEFFNAFSKDDGIWEIEDKVTVINMNGFFYNSNFADLDDLNRSTIYDVILNDIKNENYFDTKNLNGPEGYRDNSNAELVRFAWESDNYKVAMARDKVKGASNVVIVGYTFPLYNRLVDLTYFNDDMLYGKRVILQDPNAMELENDIVESFSLKPQNLKGGKIVARINCDNFFIPNDIFHGYRV